MRFAINPQDEDRYEENPAVEAERVRLEQWDIFVASIRDQVARDGHFGFVLDEAAGAYLDEYGHHVGVRDEIKQFADLYGWPDTLRAIAHAMSADEQAKQEAMDRR